MPDRSTREVIDDHLFQRRDGSFEEDLERNYAEDVVLLTQHGRFDGIDGVRASEERLGERVQTRAFTYDVVLVDGDVAFLRWTGRSKDGGPVHGADSYVVRGGRIAVQTIGWTVGGEPG